MTQPITETESVIERKTSFSRVLLKISGDGFCRTGETGIAMQEVLRLAHQVKRAAEQSVQLAIVIGGGNILRGAQFSSVSDAIKEPTVTIWGCWLL